jgi:cyclase
MNYLTRARITILLFLLVIMLKGLPALAQTDFSGEWTPLFHEDDPDRGPGPDLGDYAGYPINDAARMRADTWKASSLGLPEWQCRPHDAFYRWRGTGGVRIWKDIDPITLQTHTIYAQGLRAAPRVVYMDSRPHPSESAQHTWVGFSTGEWVGNMLKVTTTHLKEGYIKKNGLPESDLATETEYWIRNGDILTIAVILYDPVYLEEPFIQTSDFRWSVHQEEPPNPCEVREETDRPKGEVPHFLPGTNPYLSEYEKMYPYVPAEAARGGADTVYPEYKPGKASPVKLAGKAVRDRAPQIKNSDKPGELTILPLRGNVYLIAGAGANITVTVGIDGVLLVDTGTAEKSEKVLETIRQLQAKLEVSDRPIRYVINTSMDRDHTGGNETIAAAGLTVLVSGGGVIPIKNAESTATVFAHENVLARMTAPDYKPPIPSGGLPTDTYFSDAMKVSRWMNGNGVQLLHQPGHTDGDTIAYFHGADIISTGDLFVTNAYPHIDIDKGGSVQGIIAGLNRILDIAVPDAWDEGGTIIVPGHGRLCDFADVAYYRDMVTIIRDRVQDMVKKHMSLAQVKAAKPTLDYDTRYGATTGPWTTDMFVEAVYRSLSTTDKQPN